MKQRNQILPRSTKREQRGLYVVFCLIMNHHHMFHMLSKIIIIINILTLPYIIVYEHLFVEYPDYFLFIPKMLLKMTMSWQFSGQHTGHDSNGIPCLSQVSGWNQDTFGAETYFISFVPFMHKSHWKLHLKMHGDNFLIIWG